jgi:hypothetical protein
MYQDKTLIECDLRIIDVLDSFLFQRKCLVIKISTYQRRNTLT